MESLTFGKHTILQKNYNASSNMCCHHLMHASGGTSYLSKANLQICMHSGHCITASCANHKVL